MGNFTGNQGDHRRMINIDICRSRPRQRSQKFCGCMRPISWKIYVSGLRKVFDCEIQVKTSYGMVCRDNLYLIYFVRVKRCSIDWMFLTRPSLFRQILLGKIKMLLRIRSKNFTWNLLWCFRSFCCFIKLHIAYKNIISSNITVFVFQVNIFFSK